MGNFDKLDELQAHPVVILGPTAFVHDGYITKIILSSQSPDYLNSSLLRPLMADFAIRAIEDQRRPNVDTVKSAKRVLYGLLEIARVQLDTKAISELEGALTLLEL